jgi:hypothetical protein
VATIFPTWLEWVPALIGLLAPVAICRKALLRPRDAERHTRGDAALLHEPRLGWRGASRPISRHRAPPARDARRLASSRRDPK